MFSRWMVSKTHKYLSAFVKGVNCGEALPAKYETLFTVLVSGFFNNALTAFQNVELIDNYGDEMGFSYSLHNYVDEYQEVNKLMVLI